MASRTGYDALRIAAAVYLGWLGLRTLNGRVHRRHRGLVRSADPPGHPRRQVVHRPATQRWMHRITGVTLVGFAVGMVAESA